MKVINETLQKSARWKMTNELEKQFFKYFGIEPRYEDACTVEDKYWDNEELANEYGTFDQYMNCKCGDQENCTTECSCAYQKEVYPEITDNILLELLVIMTRYTDIIDGFDSVQELKEFVLKELMYSLTQPECNIVKHQVRTLFEDSNE